MFSGFGVWEGVLEIRDAYPYRTGLGTALAWKRLGLRVLYAWLQ